MARTAPGEIRAQLPASPPEQGESFDAMLRDFDTIIAPGITNWQSPKFFGFFPGAGSLASVLGDYLSSGLSVLGLSWQACPALTELEEVVTDWMRQMVGLSDAWSGVIQDTASTSTLVALLCARERSTDYALARGGLQAADRPLTVYVSAHAHSSVDKAALLAGFGRDNVRLVPHDGAYAMRADALRDMIAADVARRTRSVRRGRDHRHHRNHGHRSRARDRRRGAGARALAARGRRHGRVGDDRARTALVLWDGIEGADSLVLNPHKWLGVVFDCSLYYVQGRRASGARDVHQPELSAERGRRAREELPRLGHSAGPPVPRPQALVPDSRTGRGRPAGAHSPRPGQREVAGTARCAPSRTGASSRRWRCRRCACDTSRPGVEGDALDRHTLRLGGSGEPVRRSLSHPVRCSTAAGWRVCPSAPKRRSASTWRPCGI